MFMAVLLQGVEDSCSKLSLTKKADMSKVNSKFPNCFQSVQLFLSMSSCLPSFVLKGLRGGGEGESRVVNDFKSTSTFVY